MTDVAVLKDFSQAAIELANSQQSAAWLADVRKTGLAEFSAMPFPTRKTEDWKYTSLHPLTQVNYNQGIANTQVVTGQNLFEIPDLDAQRIVFINGHYNAELSDNLGQSGVDVVTFSNANAQQQSLIAQHIGKVVETKRNLFTALNNGSLNEGVFVSVAKNTQVNKPIQIVHISTAQPNESTAFARHLVVVEPLANVTIIEQFVSTHEAQNTLFNQTTEMVVADGAHVEHYRLHTEHESCLHMGGVYVDLNRDSQFSSYQILLGGKIKRLDVLVNHNQPGSHAEMKGVYLPKNDQHVDIHSYIEHISANCTTSETYRGIMADRSKAVFNGRIHIHPDAQKTFAELSNKNLLLSDKAQINTKPELEIYADDVRCAHGATVAQLDEKARFYLRSRGISAQEADILLSFGFINELLDSIPLQALRIKLRPLMAEQFSSDENLTQHILADVNTPEAIN